MIFQTHFVHSISCRWTLFFLNFKVWVCVLFKASVFCCRYTFCGEIFPCSVHLVECEKVSKCRIIHDNIVCLFPSVVHKMCGFHLYFFYLCCHGDTVCNPFVYTFVKRLDCSRLILHKCNQMLTFKFEPP